MAWSSNTGVVRSRRPRLSRSSSPSLSSSNHYCSIDAFEEENIIIIEEQTKGSIDESLKNSGNKPEQKKSTNSTKIGWVGHFLTEASPSVPSLPSETPASLFRDALVCGAQQLSTSLFLSNSWDQAQATSEKDIYSSRTRRSQQHSYFTSIPEKRIKDPSGPCQNSNSFLPFLETSFAEAEDDTPTVPSTYKKENSEELSTRTNNIFRDQKQTMTYVANPDAPPGSAVVRPEAGEASELKNSSDTATTRKPGAAMDESPIHDESPLHDNQLQDVASTTGSKLVNKKANAERPQTNTSQPPSSPQPFNETFQGLTTNPSVALDVGQESTIIYPPFQFSELVLGKKIGSGGFCIVHDIVDIKLQNVRRNNMSYSSGPDTTRKSQEDEYQRGIYVLREGMAKTCVDRDRRPHPYPLDDSSRNGFVDRLSKLVSAPPKVHRSPGAPASPLHLSYNYVMKMLRHDIPEEELRKGVTDMAIESNYLQGLSHPNIIFLKGMADVDTLNNRADFFLILEKLQCTLDWRVKEWRREVGRSKIGYCCFPFGLLCPDQPRLHRLWEDRFVAAHDIASAIEYLHSKRIVYRDLKPENVGFDAAHNQVKIFDFGLAKTLPPEESFAPEGTFKTSAGTAGAGIRDPDTGLYHLTGNTGSLRYMAPEVALNQPYDQRVDAYSFGVLFWQICALSVPYGGYSCKMHSDLVVRQGYRPKVYPSWPAHWGQLMRECWAGDISVRPTFTHIVSVLAQQLEEMQGSSFSPTFKHRKVKEEKVGKDGKALDVDTRVVQQGAASEIDMVNLPRRMKEDDAVGKESDFVQPESEVV